MANVNRGFSPVGGTVVPRHSVVELIDSRPYGNGQILLKFKVKDTPGVAPSKGIIKIGDDFEVVQFSEMHNCIEG